jgi:hypothetical protein
MGAMSGELQNQVMRAFGQREATARVLRPLKRPFRITYRTPWPYMPDRVDFGELLNQRGLLGCGVEVGVQEGKFSEVLLDGWRGRHLISVDPWTAAPWEEYVDVSNVAQEAHDANHAETERRLARFADRSTIWKMYGDEAAERIPHHSLDLAYIDARHDYDAVLEDLTMWADKVRPGGVFAGHDDLDGFVAGSQFGVKSAVREFFAARGLRVNATFADPPFLSWFVVMAQG